MAWSFGNIFRDAARVAPDAMRMGAQAWQNAPARQLQELQVQQLMQEMQWMQEADSIVEGLTATEQDNRAALGLTERLKTLSVLPPKDRKIVLDSFAKQMQSTGSAISPEAMSFLKSADEETLNRFLDESAAEIASDPAIGQKKVAQRLADGPAFIDSATKTMTSVARERKELEAQSAKAGESGGDMPKAMEVLSRERRQEQFAKAKVAREQKNFENAQRAVDALRARGIPDNFIQKHPIWARYQDAQKRVAEAEGTARQEAQDVLELEKGEIGEQRQIGQIMLRDQLGDQDRIQGMQVDLLKDRLMREQQGMQSPAGKLVEDAARAEKIWGTGSPQAKAMQEAVAKETEGVADLTAVGGMRKEFTSLSGDFITIRDSIDRIEESAVLADGPGDLSIIFNYMKMLDPNSVVRESEFANAETSSEKLTQEGMPSQFIKVRDQILSGARLTPGQRKQYLNAARKLFDAAKENQKLLESQYTDLADRNKINPKDVVIDFLGEPSKDDGPDIDALLNKYK